MSNIIDKHNSSNLVEIANAQSQKVRNVSDSTTNKNQSLTNNTVDTVSITASGQKIAQLEKTQSQTGEPFDQTRVDELRSRISNGEFQPDANKIADKLLEIDSKLR